jgi:hypothetical protein
MKRHEVRGRGLGQPISPCSFGVGDKARANPIGELLEMEALLPLIAVIGLLDRTVATVVNAMVLARLTFDPELPLLARWAWKRGLWSADRPAGDRKTGQVVVTAFLRKRIAIGCWSALAPLPIRLAIGDLDGASLLRTHRRAWSAFLLIVATSSETGYHHADQKEWSTN